jgi:hypothetical protein
MLRQYVSDLDFQVRRHEPFVPQPVGLETGPEDNGGFVSIKPASSLCCDPSCLMGQAVVRRPKVGQHEAGRQQTKVIRACS